MHVDEGTGKSRLVSTIMGGDEVKSVVSIRFDCSFTRDGVTIFVGSWLLCSILNATAPGGESIRMGRVLEIVEVVRPDSVELLFSFEEYPLLQPDPDRGDVMFAPTNMWESTGTHVYILTALLEISLLHVTVAEDGSEVCVQEVH